MALILRKLTFYYKIQSLKNSLLAIFKAMTLSYNPSISQQINLKRHEPIFVFLNIQIDAIPDSHTQCSGAESSLW